MTQSSEMSLSVPGVVSVAKSTGVVETGVAAGWIATPGIKEWSQELSLIARADLTDALRDELGLTLPEYRIAKGRHPNAFRAASSLPLLAVTSDMVPKLIEKGVRVYTVGFDRVTGGFVYFAKGGKGENLEIHGDLLEIIAPTLETSGATNADIEKHLDRFIDRLLVHFSGGLLDEQRVELANALPRLAVDARGMQGVDLDAFEAEAAANEERGKKHAESAKKLASALEGANGSPAQVPLFGEAKKNTLPAMEVLVGGKKTALPARALWVVTGEPKETVEPVKEPVKEKKPAAATQLGLGVVPLGPVGSTPTPAVVSARTATPAPVSSPRTATPAPVSSPKASPKPPVVEAKSPKPAAVEAKASPKPPVVEAKPASPKPPVVEPKPIVAAPVVAIGGPATELEKKPEPEKKAEPLPTPEPMELRKAEEKKPEPEKAPEPEKKAEEKKPEPEKKKAEPEKKKAEEKPKAEAKAPKEERAIEKKKAEEPAPPPPEPKSNTMLFVIIALVVIAAIAFFMMKKH